MSITLTATVYRPGRVQRGRQSQVAVLAGAETLPFVLENVATRPAFLELHGEFGLRRLEAGQRRDAADTRAHRHLDDFLALQVVEVHRPIIHPVSPVLGELLFPDDAIFALADFVELPLLAHDFALAYFHVAN